MTTSAVCVQEPGLLYRGKNYDENIFVEDKNEDKSHKDYILKNLRLRVLVIHAHKLSYFS